MAYTVSEVAKMAGTTERTLRYYDQVGLLTPSGYSEAGYRLYGEEDLKKLQKILFFREMDFSLEKIALLLKGDEIEQIQSLQLQKKFLQKCASRYTRLAQLAQDTIEEMKGMKTMNQNKRFEPFKQDSMKELQKQYEDEAKERWGETQAYQTSQQRTGKYSKQQWQEILQKQDENMKKLAGYMNQGLMPESDEVQVLVDQNRQWIDQYFYPCSKEMMGNLGELYMTDERFKATYEKISAGLTEYYCKAIEYFSSN